MLIAAAVLQAELMDVDDQVEHKRARDGADSSSEEQGQQEQQVRVGGDIAV